MKTDYLHRIWVAMTSRATGDRPEGLPWRCTSSVGQPMVVQAFRLSDGTVTPVVGLCRGLGPISADLGTSEDPIGLWDEAGRYYVVHVDVSSHEKDTTLVIAGRTYHYPLARSLVMDTNLDPESGVVVGARPTSPPKGRNEPHLDRADPRGDFEPQNAYWVCVRH